MALDALLTDDYKVALEVFEGPLDLLLYLIRREEIDIYDIPIERVTAQYMEYLDMMRMLDLNIAGEFLVMAATLMMIKSRMLLPVESRSTEEPADDEWIDPRLDLVRQLVEYKKFKDAAARLLEMETLQNLWRRETGVRKHPGGCRPGARRHRPLRSADCLPGGAGTRPHRAFWLYRAYTLVSSG